MRKDAEKQIIYVKTKLNVIKMNKVLLTIVFIAFTNFQSFSQILQGTIYSKNRTPIEGAYVIHLVSDHHAHSNQLGQFMLPGVKNGDTVQVSHIGYEVSKILVEDVNEKLNIRLKEVAIELSEMVFNQRNDPLHLISRIDLEVTPVNTSQDVLRKVPGLFIAQHAGGGKAEQIFLRGFDIDHGTDINITVDGLPVNMVSHAHGQGYADLHWLIPETVERVDFGKGPYNSNKGNFATAGYVNFQTKRNLDKNIVKFDFGRFNTLRTLGMFNLLNEGNQNAYVATEYLYSDGPFESSQNFNRINIMGKYNASLKDGSTLSLMASHFTSQWDASGQIPDRAVRSGQITRFGALDDTEGGATDRTNIALDFTKVVNENVFIKNNLYFSEYNFELYSNFTFFLEDSINGDQIRQRENRKIFGVESQINYFTPIGGNEMNFQFAVGLRNDRVFGSELSSTLNRDITLRRTQLGDVIESNYYAYANFDFYLGKLTINPGIRLDYFQYNYQDALIPAYQPQTLSKPVASPKLNFIYNFNESFQAYLKSGIGFHSNDTRIVLERDDNRDILPQAYGADLGGIWKATPNLVFNAAGWYLFSEQEFVYVGDAGIVEPSGKSERKGVDIGLRYQFARRFFLDGDFTYSDARAVDEREGENFIPLAPRITTVAGLSYQDDVFSAALRSRYLQDRPANEDNSVTALGYTVFDANAAYTFRNLTLGLAIENLFDVDWNEAQFDTESRIRLADGSLEPEPVSELHYTPGVPFSWRLSLKYIF